MHRGEQELQNILRSEKNRPASKHALSSQALVKDGASVAAAYRLAWHAL